MASATTETLKTYRGSCHCGDFIFEATMPEIKEVTVCNCSICYKKGLRLVFADIKDVKIAKGAMDDLTSYRFGGRNLSHMFCPKCGIAVVATADMMPDKIGINARAIQGPIDLWNIREKPYEGKSLAPEYTPPSFDDVPDPAVEVQGGQIYHGSCHCKGVRVALKIAPIPRDGGEGGWGGPTECNCSICQRIGAVWIYPPRNQVVMQVAEPSLLSSYRLKITTKQFCSRCGVFISCPYSFESDEEFALLPEGVRTFLADKRHRLCLNLRLFPEIDVADVGVYRFDGRNILKPAYVNP